MRKRKDKVAKVMSEFKAGSLRSGSKSGPRVKNRKQAIAIAMSEAGKSKRSSSKRGANMSAEEFEKRYGKRRLDA